jgi:hypothetical protein
LERTELAPRRISMGGSSHDGRPAAILSDLGSAAGAHNAVEFPASPALKQQSG